MAQRRDQGKRHRCLGDRTFEEWLSSERVLEDIEQSTERFNAQQRNRERRGVIGKFPHEHKKKT